MLDIKEAIKGNKNYGHDDLCLLSLPLFIESVGLILTKVNCLFLLFNTCYLSLSLVTAKSQWPTLNKNKIPRIFLSGNSIKENSGQLTVSEVQLSSSSPFKRVVYSLLLRQPGKSFDTEQVGTRTLSKGFFNGG